LGPYRSPKWMMYNDTKLYKRESEKEQERNEGSWERKGRGVGGVMKKR
jgi:hypothetical protein